MFSKFVLFFFIVKCNCEFDHETNYNLTLLLKWNLLDYKWTDADHKQNSIKNGSYIPRNNFLRDFRLWRDSAFITLPRWKSGIPATLVKIPIISETETSSPILEPYPSWAMQKLDDCFALQSVHSIEIDYEDKLWILDNGAVEELETNRIVCPPKLVIIDLKTNFIIRSLEIPADMIRNGSIFTSITLDKAKEIIYIADSNSDSSGFVTYNFSTAAFRRYECEHLNPDEESANINYIPGKLISQFVSVSLNTDRNKIYFSNFDSDDLLFINITIFDKNISDISVYVDNLGKYGRSVEIISDNKGYMYFDILNHKAVAQWRESSWVFQYTPHIVAQSKLICHWISALDIDEDGYLWVVSNRFHDYANNRLHEEKENFRIFRMFVPRKEKPKKPKPGFNAEYVVLILFIIIIGLIIIEILMFNAD